MHLKQLSISGFRGVGSHLGLPLGHRTIIYGPNGSGKSSVLQAVAWSIYGKLPFMTGTVFAREDALVNDFLSDARTEIALALSDGTTMTRARDKQGSTGRGTNPVSVSFETEDAQAAIVNLVDLNLEEFFAAVFLHQETIRDFITTTPEKRSATIDRMLGTYLLRTLIRVIDPRVPAKAIEEANESIKLLDLQLSQASVISREMIQKRKEEHGDPAELPGLLVDIRRGLAPAVAKLGLSTPEATLPSIEDGLAAARRAQLSAVSALENRIGQLNTLRERYLQAAITSWQSVRERREQFGDPADLQHLLKRIRLDLIPVSEKLDIAPPGATMAELVETLAAARRAQPRLLGQLEESIGELGTLKERYEQAAVASWHAVRQRRQQYGDPASLPHLLKDIQCDLLPTAEKLGLQTPSEALFELEETLAMARRVQPITIGKLQKRAGQISTLRERYQQISKEVIEDVSVPLELTNRRSQVQAQIKAVGQELSVLNRQLARRQAIEQDLADLRRQVQALPTLRDESEQLQRDLDTLEAAGRQGKLYNQVLSIGRDYLEQAQPEQCPLCKQQVTNLEALLTILREEVPADVKSMREEFKALHEALVRKRDEIGQLEQSQKRISELEADLTEFAEDLEPRIGDKQEENENLASELTATQAEIAKYEGRIKLATEHRSRLKAVLQEIETELGQALGEDVSATLDRAIGVSRERAAEIEGVDFEPIAAKLDHARQLSQIEKEEAELQRRLDAVLEEIEQSLSQPLGEDVTYTLDQIIQGIQERVSEVENLDFEPIAAKVDQAKQLSQIAKDEAELRRRLDVVLEEIEGEIGQPPGEDVAGTLDQAIEATRRQAAEIQTIKFQPIAGQLIRARHLDEIQKDETRLQEYESGYRTARRQKARLGYQIQRLTDLRSALLDIAQTAKRHQQTIVTGILNELDIDRYYQQLDPHPAYRQLQIEPELTKTGTYSYWIKAVTDDRAHGTYVQTRFSTAQANCAAIAIFLAVNQHLSKKLETLILDDPSQSMDPEHQMRLAQTLATIPRQVIVATEDPQMFRFLVEAFESPTIHRLDMWTEDGVSLAK